MATDASPDAFSCQAQFHRARTTVPRERQNGVAYFVARLRDGGAIEAPHSLDFNMEMEEITSLAFQALRTGRAEVVPAKGRYYVRGTAKP